MEEEIKNESDLIRVELRLSQSELEVIKNVSLKRGVVFNSNPNLIYTILSLIFKFTPRTEKPKGQRGQGRKKKVVN